MSNGADPAIRHARAWLFLVGALALHVVDEAVTDFLDFYNPLVRQIRAEVAWFPMPVFTFGAWIVGLGALVVLLLLLAPAVKNGAVGTRVASWLFATLMFLNGVGHLAGSLYFGRWLPGATTAPLLLIASVILMRATARRGRAS